MPGDTPKACPYCGMEPSAGRHANFTYCEHPCHATPAPDPFDAALAALDVEPRHDAARMVTTYDILGLDAVRAAHREAIRVAVEAERVRCVNAVQSVGGPGEQAHVAAILNTTQTAPPTPVKAPRDDAEIGFKRYVVAVFHHPEHAGKAREFGAGIKYWDPSWSGFCGTHKVVAKNGRDAKRIAINAERKKRGLEPK